MSPLLPNRQLFSQRLVRTIFFGSVALLLVLYGLFQARFLLQGPVVEFSALPDQVQHERVVRIEGIAQNIVTIELNDREIYTDKNGYFNEAVVLENGYTITTIKAHDRYGRTRSYAHSFVYQGS